MSEWRAIKLGYNVDNINAKRNGGFIGGPGRACVPSPRWPAINVFLGISLFI